MTTIKETIKSKPSIALKAMVAGLRKTIKRSTFVVDMGTFGSTRRVNRLDDLQHHKTKKIAKAIMSKEICFGCASTCTIQELTKKNFTKKTIRDRHTNFELLEQREFELAMDSARQGRLMCLFQFCGVRESSWFDDHFFLNNQNWVDQLGEVEKVITMLEKDGL
jgi:hypothetical protein